MHVSARARAPGKVMLAGEYAVLDGGDALVMAVDRHARAEVFEDSPDSSSFGASPPEVIAALDAARHAGLLRGAHPVRLDVADLARDGRKLGLGSSAAGCVAALAAAAAAEGVDVAASRGEIARVARRGHRAAQGGGSGVDVLASATGGVVRVSFPGGPDGEPEVTRVEWPAQLPWAVYWTGRPARTSDMIARVRAFGGQRPDALAALFARIRDATRELEEAARALRTDQTVSAVRLHFEAMDELGRSCDTEIVTGDMRRFASAIEPLGAAVKPSGAGGGDIVFVATHDTAALDAVTREGRAMGFDRIQLAVDLDGARVLPV